MEISIIIPAYNEERYILNTINSIKKWMPQSFEYEIIVVDHDSQDSTAKIAREAGANVINGAALKTVAALRNFGVTKSTGNILFFIDADITFSEKWLNNISGVISSLKNDENQICGSLPLIPDNANYFIKSWFNPKALETSPNYIGSCHLITSRSLFERIKGFPENLETSEEFTLCKNAREAGAIIKANPSLIVTHHGAPKTITLFIKSEIWHGRGDWTNISTVLASKVAILTLIYVLLHALLITSAFIPISSTAVVFAIFFLCATSSFIKFIKYGIKYFLSNIFTFYFYFLGRSFSLISALKSKDFNKRSRED